jgi:hypothetical protein
MDGGKVFGGFRGGIVTSDAGIRFLHEMERIICIIDARSRNIIRVLCGLPVFAFLFCISTASFQEARTLDENQLGFGGGPTSKANLDVFLRYGLTDRVDIGYNIDFLNSDAQTSLAYLYMASISLKHSLLRLKKAPYLSLSYSFAYLKSKDNDRYVDENGAYYTCGPYYDIIFTPALLFGTDWFSTGLRFSGFLGQYDKKAGHFNLHSAGCESRF